MSARRKVKLDWTAPGDLERYGLLALAAVLLLAVAWLVQSLLGEIPQPDRAPLEPSGVLALEWPEPAPAAAADAAEAAEAAVEGVRSTEPEPTSDQRADAPGGGFAPAATPAALAAPSAPALRPFDFFEPPVRLPGRPAIVAPPPPGAPRGERFVVVGDGDTLQKIAARELGGATHWRRLLDWNPGLDPRRLRKGMKLVLPLAVAPAPATAPAAETSRIHVVAAGETLRELARRYLGDERRFTDLLEYNRDQLARPEALRVGMRIRIP